MAEQFWAACRTFTNREHLVRAKLEKVTAVLSCRPIFGRGVSGDRASVAERAAVPVIVFFRVNGDDCH